MVGYRYGYGYEYQPAAGDRQMTTLFLKLFLANGLMTQLLRGVFGLPLLAWAIVHANTDSLIALAAGSVALIALRGCPMCWLLGFCFIPNRKP